MDIIGIEHIIRHVPLIHIHMCPLSALCLVAGYGVCEFHLQSIEELIMNNKITQTLRRMAEMAKQRKLCGAKL